MHVANAKSSKTTPKIASLFKATAPDRVTHAEVLFSAFVAEHNLPFAVADHFTDLCQHMFPDYEIAKKFACRRTKTTHIINRAIAPSFDSKVTEACKTEKFSIMVDESNDQGGEKNYGDPDQSGRQIPKAHRYKILSDANLQHRDGAEFIQCHQ